ncbi:MAG: hypothetical protein U0136_20230 [Bdellovibrionota bacterium]
MRTPKESSREQSKKTTVVGKAIKGSTKVKVVDVELRSKSKSKAKKKSAGSPTAKRLLKVRKESLKSRPAKKAAPAKAAPAPVKEKERAAQKVVKAAKPEPAPEIITVPTEKLLRPFRRAAELNRQHAKQLQRARAQKGSFLAKPVKKGKRYLIDLRVHAPGTVGYFANGGIAAGPALIRLANVKGLHMIGLTEYYNASYLDQVRSALTPESGLVVLPGVVICCEVGGCREVPILVLFPETVSSETIYGLLEALEVPRSAYGKKDYCLSMNFGKVLETIEAHGAIAIPSRVDKTPYRQLAIAELVDRYGMHAFDLAHPDSPDLFRDSWPNGGFTFFSFSSANALGQIGNRVGKVTLAQLGFEGLREIVKRREPGAATTEPAVPERIATKRAA